MLKFMFGKSSSLADMFTIGLGVWVYLETNNYLWTFGVVAVGALVSVIGDSVIESVNKNNQVENKQ